jgi:hypothetical protein
MPPMRMRRRQCRLRIGAMLIVFASVVLSEAQGWNTRGDGAAVATSD